MSYNEEAGSSKLAITLKRFDLVFLDTCSLMEETFPLFMDYLVGSRYYLETAFHKSPKFILVYAVINELKNHALDKNDEKKQLSALRALKIINDDQKIIKGSNLFTIERKTKDDFADPLIKARVTEFKIKNKILVITQDKMLADGIKSTNNDPSQKGRFVEVCLINSHSELEINFGERKISSHTTPFKPAKQTSSKTLEKTSLSHTLSHQPAKINVLSDGAKKAQSFDALLKTNLNNPNYPIGKKIADIDLQIELLDTLSTKEAGSISLHFNYDELVVKRALLLNVEATTNRSTSNQIIKNDILPANASTSDDTKPSLTKESSSKLKKIPSPKEKNKVHLEEKNTLTKRKSSTSSLKKKKKETSDIVIANNGNSVAPEGVNLIVAEPPKPVKSRVSKQKVSTKEKTKTNPKPVMATAKNKVVTGKVTRSISSKSKESTALKEVKKVESRLKANLSNPNYPNEKKLEDIKVHKKKIGSLSKEERASLLLDEDSLRAKEDEIEASKDKRI